MENKSKEANSEQSLRDILYKEARTMTLDKLPEFLERVKECSNGYGECCIAMAAGALATMWALDKEIGVTGFQASCALWEVIRDWKYPENKCGLRIVNYDDMLYPQYAHNFDKTISENTWQCVQKEAGRLLKEYEGSLVPTAAARVVNHWKDICNGRIPFGYKVKEE